MTPGRLTLSITVILGALFTHAIAKKMRTEANPVKDIDLPQGEKAEGDLRFLTVEEVEALLRAVPDDELGKVERPMYLTAALTGLRQGELFALRWRDVDITAAKVRAITVAVASGPAADAGHATPDPAPRGQPGE